VARLLRRILGYLGPYRLPFAAALGQVFLISALELAKPWPLKLVVDHALAGHPVPWDALAGWSPEGLVAAAALGLVTIYLLLAGFTLLNNYTTIAIGQRMVNDLRRDLFGHLQRLSLGFHSRHHVGDLLYRVTADTYAIQTVTMNGLFPVLSALVLVIGMFVVLVRLDALLTVLALAVVPALFVSIVRLHARITGAAQQARERESAVYSLVQRAMSAVRVIQAFTTEDVEHRRFVTASRRSLDASLRLYTLQTLHAGVVNVVIAVGTALVIWVGARRVLAGALTVGELIVFVSYLASLYVPVSTMLRTWGLVLAAKAGIQRVFEVLDVERDLPDGARTFPPSGARGEVAWEGVSFEYGPGRPVLRGIDLRVPAGRTVAIVGPTGAGKSTLLSLVPRFYDPQRGRVTIDGSDVRDFQLASLRRQIAIVLQPPLVFPVSIRENIAYGRPEASLDEVVKAARQAAADDFIARLPTGYDTVVGESGVTLSEGEKQRLTIARAILRDAPILLLDEPTSSVDAGTEALIMRALERLAAGRTTFVIAHRLSTVRAADLIVVLRDGAIVEAGTFDQLLGRGGAFATLYRTQFGPQERRPLAAS
jgi:ATP-binding cassette, subfamily B, bacterial